MSRRPTVAVLAALGSLAAGGCGFHLEGRTALPDTFKISLVTAPDAQSDFVQDLRKALLASGVRLTTRSDEASGTIDIVSDTVTRKVLAVSAVNTPVEYELTYTVKFSVSAGDKEVLPEQEVSLERDFSFDETILLAKDNEETILRQALAHDLVGIVMRRLSRI